MTDDLAQAHAARVHRDDLVVEIGEAALASRQQLRVEAGLTALRHIQADLAIAGQDRLAAIALRRVSAPPSPARWWSILATPQARREITPRPWTLPRTSSITAPQLLPSGVSFVPGRFYQLAAK
jgi:hypothetical protein